MYQYLLTIPVQLHNDQNLAPNRACSLIDSKMQDYTKEVLQFQADMNQYPDLLAKFILNTQLKSAVAAITYDHAEFHHDEYAIVFKILAKSQINPKLAKTLINFMDGQMSDGLLENGLTLIEHINKPNNNEKDHYYDVVMWPELISSDHYDLTELSDWFIQNANLTSNLEFFVL